MVHPSVIEARIGKLGFRHSRWFRAEIQELQHILMDHEEIIVLACGRYYGSFALLVATDQRLLLIDKRVFFMTIEDTRYDMISEIDYNSQVYSAQVTIYTMNKTHKFSSIKFKKELRELTNYVQRRVMEIRQQQPTNVPKFSAAEQIMHNRPAPTYSAAVEQYELPRHAVAPAPFAAPLTDYYNDGGGLATHRIKERVGHVAHLIGSAATQAAHHQPNLSPSPLQPYVQGSMMARRPII